MDEQAGRQVTAALEAIAAQQGSGVLEIHGHPAGTVYFDEGQITFARASWIPDLSARLLAVLSPSAESRDLLDGDHPEGDICATLVRQNDLTLADLQKLLRSVVVDAVIALTMPSDKEAFVSDIRFATSGPHWSSAFSRLPVDSTQIEATRTAERLARHRLARTTHVQLRDLNRPSAVLNREQWAIACTIGRGLPIQDLAWQCGLALYEAIEAVGDLIRAGMCAPEPGPDAAIRPVPGVFAPLPRRTPGSQIAQAQYRMGTEFSVAAEPWTAEAQLPHGSEFGPTPAELLHRVLDGVRKIS